MWLMQQGSFFVKTLCIKSAMDSGEGGGLVESQKYIFLKKPDGVNYKF